MIAPKTINQSIEGSEHHSSPHVISEFDTKDSHYLVLVVEESAYDQNRNGSLISFLKRLKISSFSAVDHFRLHDQYCLIVEVQSQSENDQIDLVSLLTARELQIATLVAQGFPNKKVAKQLHISKWTVATHIRRIFAKLHVDSRAAMVFRCAPLIQDLQQLSGAEKQPMNLIE